MKKYQNYLTKSILSGLSNVYQHALHDIMSRQGSTDLDLNFYRVWLNNTFEGEELKKELETLDALLWLLKFISIQDKKRAEKKEDVKVVEVIQDSIIDNIEELGEIEEKVKGQKQNLINPCVIG